MDFISVPSQAQSPAVVNSTTSSMTLAWTETNEGLAERTYILSWSPPNQIGDSNRNASSPQITVDDLVSNTNYTFTVAATNDGGTGASSEQRSFVTRECFLFTADS